MSTIKTAVAIFFLSIACGAQVNNGFGFPLNGPCTPTLTSPGICNDAGVLIGYDTNGKKYPLLGGTQGPKGDPGQAATISVGTVTSGPAPSVTNSGTSSNAVFDFVLQKGDPGKDGVNGLPGINGAPASVNIGTVVTGAPGSPAQVVNAGTSQNAVLNFSIPQGLPGTYPNSFTLTCAPTAGSVPKGFTAKCSITVP